MDELCRRLKEYLNSTDVGLREEDIISLCCWIRRGFSVIVRQQSAPARWERMHPNDIYRYTLSNFLGPEKSIEESYWCAFIATHWGRSSAGHHWTSAGMFYLGFGEAPIWTWEKVTSDLPGFQAWLADRMYDIQYRLLFGNHRKNESKQPDGLFSVFESYVQWIRRYGGSQGLQATAFSRSGETRKDRFGEFFDRFRQVHRIGRLGAFDHLTMLQNFGILDVEPRSTYIEDSSGPLAGAKQLWPRRPAKVLEKRADKLAEYLGVPYQAIEDALCNWQKGKPCEDLSEAEEVSC